MAEMPPASAPARYRIFLEGVEGNQIIAFGEQLKAARKRHGLTLAAVADHAGISAALLSRLKRGQLKVSHVFRFDPPEGRTRGPTLVVRNPYLADLCAADQDMSVHIRADAPQMAEE